MTLYLRLAVSSLTAYSPTASILIKSPDQNTILSGTTSPYSFTPTHQGPAYIRPHSSMYQSISKDQTNEFYFDFRLASHSLAAGDYIVVSLGDWVIDTAPSEGRTLWRYRCEGDLFWVPAEVEDLGANQFQIFVREDYGIDAN